MNIEPKPLAPLPNGVIVIVGARASNFAQEIARHPRVLLWDSQQHHWHGKDLPSNTRVVFLTRFVGHRHSERLIVDARKRHITIFNTEGTGQIAKQVRELLSMTRPETTETPEATEAEALVEAVELPPVVAEARDDDTDMQTHRGKLKPLIALIDFSRTTPENVTWLLAKARELKIKTTKNSISQMVQKARRAHLGLAPPPSATRPSPKKAAPAPEPVRSGNAALDVSVVMLDDVVKQLQDMRAFLIETVDENRLLKSRIARLKQSLDEA